MTARPLAVQLDAFRAGPRKPRTPSAPYQPSSATSRAGSEYIRPYVPTQLARVFDFIASRGAYGATPAEIAVALDMRRSSVCGRIGTLKRPHDGQPPLVVETGETRDDPETGRPCEVLRAVRTSAEGAA